MIQNFPSEKRRKVMEIFLITTRGSLPGLRGPRRELKATLRDPVPMGE
jgi:hypothetical protein